METRKYLLTVGLIILASCNKSDSPSLPLVSVSNLSQNRTVSTSQFEFIFSLDKVTSSDVSFQYVTQGSTAVANKDFLPLTGVLLIPAGNLTGSVKITVTGDSTRKENQEFSMVLSDPRNCTLQTTQVTGTIVNENGLYFPVDSTGYTTPTQYAGYSLVWSDEFSGKYINQNYWSFETGNSNGWGNNELEYYTGRTQNAFVSQGNLIIEARAEDFSNFNFTSARMLTKGDKSFKYGRIDIRARLPQGKGIWPALWMLGDDIDAVSWPACGEIDIMELLGQEPDKVYGTLHWGGGANASTNESYGTNEVLTTGTFADSFHVFSMIWTQSSVELLVDDTSYFLMDTTTSGLPFNASFFFIFNIAVGGSWPGSPDSSTSFPQRMIVDYVRVFQ
jgi:hypothetical protein